MGDDGRNEWKAFTEEIEVTGQNLMREINRLIAAGNVRRLVVKSEKGDVYLSVPLTAGAVAGGLAAIAAPWLAILATVAGLVARVKIEVTRDEAPEPAGEETAGSSGPTPPSP